MNTEITPVVAAAPPSLPVTLTEETEESDTLTILAIGDPHFKVSNVDDTALMEQALLTLVRERRPDLVVVLGDILDRHETIHVSPLTRAVGFLTALREVAPTAILIGNHDLKNNRQFLSTEHPFLALRSWKGFTVADTPVTLTVKGRQLVLVPYVPPGRFQEALQHAPDWEGATAIFAHQEFRGARMGAIISTEGDDWPEHHPLVISGHIHDYQELQPNLVYTGTPFQHTFGECRKTVSWLEFPQGEEYRSSRIDLGLPRKKIVRLTGGQVPETQLPEGKLKVVISGTAGELKTLRSHPTVVRWRQQGHMLVFKEVGLTLTSPPPPGRPPRFSELLAKSIRGQTALEQLYREILNPTVTLTVVE